MDFQSIFKSILIYALIGAGVYGLLLLGTWGLGFNPLGREYSPLQALFVPFVSGACIAHFHYRQMGQRKMLELGILGLGVSLFAPIIYAFVFFGFLETNPGLVKDYIEEAKEFLEINREVYIRFSGEEEFEAAKNSLEKTTNWNILVDDLLKKLLIGFPFTILFLLLFFAMPNYFRKKNDHGKK